MNDFKLLQPKRVTAGIIVFMMLVVVLFSSFYISAEAGHDCSGEDCPVCACVQMCENTLHQLGGGVVCLLAVILPAIVLLSVIIITSCLFCQESLITNKVRLNN